ncbi:hypothetical protein QBC45DRAFT_168921 [Copromyces sp. CBS 386.78]|nr:hypothetical protein QBC45DRAFT_168921 [Copromyces sp. CBS 386.78]
MTVKGFMMGKPSSGPLLEGWKPYTMQAPVLTIVIVITLLLAGVIEFLAQKSQKQGGLALSECSDCLSDVVTFSYLYAPTVISVLYSLLWSWIDLDIRRIQPWLELSRPEGALAESSVLLDYPSTFLAFIPFTAWKKGHWPVFFSGIASMLLFWAITPLQSAIMGVKSVSFATNITVSSHLALPSPQDQAAMMDTTILHTAFGMAWLEQASPSYTTADYAIIPFSRADSPSHYLPGENLTAVTTMFTTELDCWEASVSTLPPARSYTFDNDRGCAVNVSFFQSTLVSNDSSLVAYIGYHGNAILDYCLESPQCSKNSSGQFLAIYTHFQRDDLGNPYDTDVKGVFCEPSYHKQSVSVTISAESGRPVADSVAPVGEKEPLGEGEFNATALQYLIGVGMPPPSPTRDWPASTTFEPWGSLAQANVVGPSMPMAGIAIGLSDNPPSDFRNATILKQAFTKAYKTIFTAAISQLLLDTEKTEHQPGTSHYTLNGVVVSRTISAVLEGMLIILVFLMGGVLYTSQKAKSKLAMDPATIGFTFKSVSTSRAVLNRFAMEDCSDGPTLQKSLSGEHFFLEKGDSGNSLEIEAVAGDHTKATDSRKDMKYTPVVPKELHSMTGCLLVSLLLAGAAVLIYFKKREESLQGLPRPSDNFEVLQLLENYIPTIFTTLLEPYLVLLTRVFCILQPFNDLRKGKSNPEHTLETKYTSLPPQLVLWRAIRSGHFLLTSLCIMALLVNVLTVALGGTFNEFPVQIQYPTTFNQVREARGSLTRDTLIYTKYQGVQAYYDHFYAASTNISRNTTLPPWITTHYTFLPVNLTSEHPVSSDFYRTKLRGFGAEAKCDAMSTSPTASRAFSNITDLLRGKSPRAPGPSFSFRRDNGTWTPCYPTTLLSGFDPVGKSAREVVSPLWPISYYDDHTYQPFEDHFCEDRFVVGWLRVDSKDPANTFKSSFVHCEAVLRTAMFDVEFDKAGHILGYNRSGEFEDTTKFMPLNMSQSLVRQATDLINNPSRPSQDYAWHNETFVADWWNYLLKFQLQSTDLVDPAKELPKPEAVAPAVADLYQRLFAIMLGKNLDLFPETVGQANVSGIVVVTETRIFLDDMAYLLSVVILCLIAAVLIWVYLAQSVAYLPRLPSTLGSVIAYAAASRAVREYGADVGLDGESWPRKALKTTYSFGRYLGVDGKFHIGIEMDPFVAPIDGTTLNRTSTVKSWFQKKDEKE